MSFVLRGQNSALEIALDKSDVQNTAPSPVWLEPELFNDFYARLQSDWFTSKGRQHGPTVSQPFQSKKIPLSAK